MTTGTWTALDLVLVYSQTPNLIFERPLLAADKGGNVYLFYSYQNGSLFYQNKNTYSGAGTWSPAEKVDFGHVDSIAVDIAGNVYLAGTTSDGNITYKQRGAITHSWEPSTIVGTNGTPYVDDVVIAVPGEGKICLVWKALDITIGHVVIFYQEIGLVSPGIAITSPDDLTIICGTRGNFISWAVTCTISGNFTYEIARDDRFVVNGTCDASIPIICLLDWLPVGSYNYTITVQDGKGGRATDTVVVEVAPVPQPSITNPDDIAYVEGQVGNAIRWHLGEPVGDESSYEILCNGTAITNGSWVSSTEVVQPVDGLPDGMYTFTILANDSLGASNDDSVIVMVIENRPPEISKVDNPSGTGVCWQITDSMIDQASYEILVNGTRAGNGTWASGSVVTFSTANLVPGWYNVTIIARDGLNGDTRHTTFITVVDGDINRGDQDGEENMGNANFQAINYLLACLMVTATYIMLKHRARVKRRAWTRSYSERP